MTFGLSLDEYVGSLEALIPLMDTTDPVECRETLDVTYDTILRIQDVSDWPVASRRLRELLLIPVANACRQFAGDRAVSSSALPILEDLALPGED